MARRETKPAAGLYKNGARWWVRTVRAPLSGVKKSLSTGTAQVERANAIKAMLDAMAKNPTQYEWLDAVVTTDELTLDQLFTHHAAGTLHLLRDQRAAAVAASADPDLDPWVKKWIEEHLATRDIGERMRSEYARQIRVLIPEGKRFPASQFTEDTLKAKLASLTGARHDRSARLSGGARRRYTVCWHLFYKYARKRVPLTSNPFEDTEWLPKNGSPRSTFYEHDKVMAVLDRMEGEDRAAMALVFGSGIELGALIAMHGAHVGSTLADGRGTIIAPGTKNVYREERTIFVDAWAWKIFHPFAKLKLPRARLWSYNPATAGKDLRDRLYSAQVAAGLIDEPPVNKETGKKLWGRVRPHTIHDARHSYCINRSLGLDGEPAQDAAFCAAQLGHGDEQMVLKIYKKANVKERQRLLQLQQNQKAAVAAGGAR